MVKRLSIAEFLEKSKGQCIVDVRSEGEFEVGHISGAVNIPLFNNAERAQVGTTYKKVGKQEAIVQGLEIVGPKMAPMVIQVKSIAPQPLVFVYCWRGGMRSGSMAWLLQTVGFEVYVLEGGYKAYRRHVIQFLDNLQLNLKVLSGSTGSGKTEILHLLKAQGEQMIDLEQLAHHKGSAFGGLGQPPPPTQESFDSELYLLLQNMDLSKPIWIENESKNIGRIYLPKHLFELIQLAPVYFINVPIEDRIKRLLNEYAIFSKEDLAQSVEKIKKRLGGQAYKNCITALEENNLITFTELVLFYYDRTYLKHRDKKKDQVVKEVKVINQHYEEAIVELLEKEHA
jgi:tRNA 2-selenouridine synthase